MDHHLQKTIDDILTLLKDLFSMMIKNINNCRRPRPNNDLCLNLPNDI